MQQICISLSAGNTVSKLKWGSTLQNLTSYSDANVNKFLMGLYMQFTVSFELYINIGNRYIPNMKTTSVYNWNQNRNKVENKCSSLQ